jgi:protein tyrosine/serine phosphatase
LLILLLLGLLAASRPAMAQVIGVPNFHQVTERIFRGGQPDERGWPELAKLGVKTVVDLRRPGEHSTIAESLAVVAAGMRYVNVPMGGFATPTHAQLEIPLALLDKESPVFVHCKYGCDRTGTVIAAYRISRQGWENQKALTEARQMGMHWWETGMKRFIAAYRSTPAPDTMATGSSLADAPVVASDSVRSEPRR